MDKPAVNTEWLEPEEAPLLDTLEGINDKRQIEKDTLPPPDLSAPAMPAVPAEPQAPVEPIQDKDLAKLLEDSAKTLLDASLNIEKASISLKKILIKLGPGDDAEGSKVDSIISSLGAMGEKAKAMSDAISSYRDSVVGKGPVA